MIKLFVSDLDGTLLNRQLEIEEHNRIAIEKAMAQSIHIAIASGRMSAEIRNLMLQYSKGSYAIGQNGATVYSKEHELLFAKQHQPDIAYQIMQLAKPFAGLVTFVHTIHDEAYIQESNEQTQQYEHRVLTPSKVLADLEQQVKLAQLPCSKVTFLGDIQLLRELEKRLLESLAGQIEVVVSDVDCMDVTPLHVSKGNAVKLLMDKLGLKENEVACIGDSYNDLSMFEVAEHSFAMAHSDEAIRAKAKMTVSNVAEAMEWCLRQPAN